MHLLDDGKNDGAELVVRLLHRRIDNHVGEADSVGSLDFLYGVLETELNALLRVGATTAQTSLQLLVGRRLDKNEVRLHSGLHDLLHALDIDIQNADLLLVHHLHHAVEGRAVDVAMHVGVLDELAISDILLHGVLVDEIVVNLC